MSNSPELPKRDLLEEFCRDAEELDAPQTNDELVKLAANLQNGLAPVILSTTIIISPDPN
jgi:hypothetical protein